METDTLMKLLRLLNSNVSISPLPPHTHNLHAVYIGQYQMTAILSLAATNASQKVLSGFTLSMCYRVLEGDCTSVILIERKQ